MNLSLCCRYNIQPPIAPDPRHAELRRIIYHIGRFRSRRHGQFLVEHLGIGRNYQFKCKGSTVLCEADAKTGRFEASCGVSRDMMEMFSKLVSLLPARGTLVGNRAVPDDSFSTSFLDWTPDIALAGVNERTVVGSLAFWHAGKILIWVRSRGVDPSDPQVQFSVSEIFRVCGSVGDKVEYLNWVSAVILN